MPKTSRGFTLIEIMIVVAIIGLLAAIAIPSLVRARMNSNEGAIKYDLRTFSSANEGYRSTQNPPVYADVIDTLTDTTPAYLDITWKTNPKHGFNLTYATDLASYSMIAERESDATAGNDYCVDQTGVLTRAADGLTGDTTGCSGGVAIQ